MAVEGIPMNMQGGVRKQEDGYKKYMIIIWTAWRQTNPRTDCMIKGEENM